MTPSDEVLFTVHNRISSSTNIEEAKSLLDQFPQVVSFHVLEWGGCIVLHTVCNRQPKNIQLIKLLIEEGLKQNVGGGRNVRGGLVLKDSYERTPLNALVSNNAINTLRYFQQTDPPLFIPSDVIDSQLFNSVYSNFHTDMVRYLIRFNPTCLAQVHDAFDGNTLINYMCIRLADTGFLLRVIPIFIEEGIRQQVGGEYGIGGLFVEHLGLTAADLLVDRRGLSWNVFTPIIQGAIGNAPILHGAIIARKVSISYTNHIRAICNNIGNAASRRDSKGRLPIHIAAEKGLRWKDDMMEDIVKTNFNAVRERDPVTGLPIYALAAASDYCSLSTLYELVTICIEDFIMM